MSRATLADLLGAADDETGPGLTDDQQIARLTEYFAQVYGQARERFEPGQIIWHKNPAAAEINGADAPHMFIRYLDAPIDGASRFTNARDLFSMIATARLDCVIASIRDGEGVFAEHLMDSSRYTAIGPNKPSQ